MYKTITRTGCTKSSKLCSLYPTESVYKKKVEIKFNPDICKISERRHPECWYCSRSKDKVKKDRFE